jgi:hypothetical protein
MRLWLRRSWLDLRCGECSGFPPCCIFWFLTGWKLIFGKFTVTVHDKPAWRARLILWYNERAGRRGYVPCPLCLISGARVRVWKCTDECGHRREFAVLNRLAGHGYIRDYLR